MRGLYQTGQIGDEAGDQCAEARTPDLARDGRRPLQTTASGMADIVDHGKQRRIDQPPPAAVFLLLS